MGAGQEKIFTQQFAELTFGLISSIFDYVTFGVLLWLLNATPDQFRTGWFQESVISAAVIVLVIRTRRPFFKSRPGTYLLAATADMISTSCAAIRGEEFFSC